MLFIAEKLLVNKTNNYKRSKLLLACNFYFFAMILSQKAKFTYTQSHAELNNQHYYNEISLF